MQSHCSREGKHAASSSRQQVQEREPLRKRAPVQQSPVTALEQGQVTNTPLFAAVCVFYLFFAKQKIRQEVYRGGGGLLQFFFIFFVFISPSPYLFFFLLFFFAHQLAARMEVRRQHRCTLKWREDALVLWGSARPTLKPKPQVSACPALANLRHPATSAGSPCPSHVCNWLLDPPIPPTPSSHLTTPTIPCGHKAKGPTIVVS